MKTILIADDNERIRRLLKHFFESNPGFQVQEAADGQEVLEKTPEIKPHLIVLDLVMPKVNGLEAARKLRQMKVAAPIILFTMHANEVPVTEISPTGVSAVVLKPDLTELHRQVEFLLSR